MLNDIDTAIVRRTIVNLGVAIVATAALAGCCETVDGNGQIRAESREVSAFTSVDVDDGAILEIEAGAESPTQTLMVETDENLLEWLRTSVSDEMLFVFARDRMHLNATEGLFVRARVAELQEINANNGAEVRAAGEGAELSVSANNGALVDARALEVEWAFVDANNGADVVVCATGVVRGRAHNGGRVIVDCGGRDEVQRD